MTTMEAAGAPKPRAAFGRSLADFRVDGTATPNGLLPAEEKLVAAVARGELCVVSDLDWTKAKDLKQLRSGELYHVRSGVLRCLALQYDPIAPLHEKGIELAGAYVPGELDLENAEIRAALWLHHCYFDGPIVLRDARAYTVSLSGSRIAGLSADRATFSGGVFLRNVRADGAVRLLGARIGGNLECSGAVFENKGKRALSCDRARVEGSVFLDDGFKALGEVRLLGADIGGDVTCSAGSFDNVGEVALCCDAVRIKGSMFLDDRFSAEGAVRLTSAYVDGDLSCSNGRIKNFGDAALLCDTARFGGSLFFRHGFKVDGSIDLAAAHAQNLVDSYVASDQDSASALIIDGLTYERLSGGAPTDATTRAVWLRRQPTEHLTNEFKPQPFEQLAKVLRAMGHDRDAREIGFLKEELFRPQRIKRTGRLARPFVWFQWWLYGLIAGYGYKPHRLLWILFGLWLGGAAIYWQAARHGFFVPADAEVWTQQALASCRPPAGNWADCEPAKELAPFRPLLYSADVLIPVVDMGQRKHWEPMDRSFSRTLLGFEVGFPSSLLHWIVAAENVLGTLLVLLFGALASGLVKRS